MVPEHGLDCPSLHAWTKLIVVEDTRGIHLRSFTEHPHAGGCGGFRWRRPSLAEEIPAAAAPALIEEE